MKTNVGNCSIVSGYRSYRLVEGSTTSILLGVGEKRLMCSDYFEIR
jgi:hypothetical protein